MMPTDCRRRLQTHMDLKPGDANGIFVLEQAMSELSARVHSAQRLNHSPWLRGID
jgi:hypothetical protein